MVRNTLNDGQVDDMISNYPALAVKAAQHTARRGGIDPSDPATTMKMIGTDEFRQSAAEMVDARGNTNAIAGYLGSEINVPDKSDPLSQRKFGLFEDQENNLRGRFRAQGAADAQNFADMQKLRQYAEFNETAYKTKRLKELNPTSDLDDQMMKLRFRQMHEEANIRSNPRFSHLSPAAKQRIINSNREEARGTSSMLKEIRDSKLSAAEARIDDEVASHNQIVSNLKGRMEDNKEMQNMIKRRGGNEDTLFQLRKDFQKMEGDVSKAKGKSGDASWETVEQLILSSYLESGRTVADLSADQKAEIKIMAKKIAMGQSEMTGGASVQGIIDTQVQQAVGEISGEENNVGGGRFLGPRVTADEIQGREEEERRRRNRGAKF
jgi:hypothetical protein